MTLRSRLPPLPSFPDLNDAEMRDQTKRERKKGSTEVGALDANTKGILLYCLWFLGSLAKKEKKKPATVKIFLF